MAPPVSGVWHDFFAQVRYLVMVTLATLQRNGCLYNFLQKKTDVFAEFTFKVLECPLELPWVSSGCPWVVPGCSLGASWVPPGVSALFPMVCQHSRQYPVTRCLIRGAAGKRCLA